MSAPKPIPPRWSRGRFWLVAALLFAGQAGWVLLLAERPGPSPVPAPSPLGLRLLGTPLDNEIWTKHVFAGDPAIFPSSSPHGFADQAWRRLRTNADTAPLEEPLPVLLNFAAKWSGAELKPAGLASRQTPFHLAGLPESSPSAVPAFPAAQASRPESFLRIEGALAARQSSPPAVLPSWTTNFLVTNSVVRFAVNRAGQVVSAVLLAGSGLKAADDAALATVNVLRFRPVGQSAPEHAWDTATFYWKTIPPP
ncbi:MAG: hypothetical protein ABSG78_07975 [Verrucomicrobiota bacterium]|jgi:hypothetical protein